MTKPEDKPASESKQRGPIKHVWLQVSYNEDLPYRIKLDIGDDTIPIVGHGHHNLTWLFYDLIAERDALKTRADELELKLEFIKLYFDPEDTSLRYLMDKSSTLSEDQKNKLIDLCKELKAAQCAE